MAGDRHGQSLSDTPGRTLAPSEATGALRSLVCQGLRGAGAKAARGSLVHSREYWLSLPHEQLSLLRAKTIDRLWTCPPAGQGLRGSPGRRWGAPVGFTGACRGCCSSFEVLPTAHLPLPFVGPSGQRDSLHLDRGLFFSDRTHPPGAPRSEVPSNGLSWGSSF